MPKRPYLQYKTILAIALVLLTTRIGLNSLYTGNLSIIASASDITVSSVSSAVNRERTQRNIPALAYNSKLAAAADSKSRDMIARKYFSHTDPEGHYIWDKIVANGYAPYTILGENLAIDFSDVEGLVAAWIDSPTHRANLLNTSFKDQGMGVAFGDTNAGEYSVAVTNTFGAQPIAAAPKTTTPSPTTTKTPAPKPVATKPAPIKKPATKAAETPAITLTINNSEEVSHKDSITIMGTTSPNTTFQLKDKNSTDPAITITSDSTGNFVYSYKSLNNGTHDFVASIGNVSSNDYKVEVMYNPPQINRESLSLIPEIKNNQLNIAVSAEVSGEPQSVTVSLLDKNTALTGSGGKYSGNLVLDKYSNYQSSSLVIAAADIYGNKNNLTVPLQNYPLPADQNPKDLGNLPQKAVSPDLYNTFKYIVLIAGGLFLLFLLGDTFHLTKNKFKDDFTRGSNIIVLLLMLSTLLLVTWWH